MATFTTIAVLALLLSSSHARAQVGGQPNTISVTGEADIRVVPDEVILTLGVETFDKVLKAAKAANDERIARTIGVARSHGIAAEHIQTDYVGIEPRHRLSDVALDLLGYAVRRTVVIRLRAIARFEDLLTATLDAGVTHVHGIEFRTTDLRTHRDQARVLAVKAAREKAELLARESGRTIASLQSMNEAAYGYWSSYGTGWGSRFGSASQNVVQNLSGAPVDRDVTLAPGQISIRATVHAVFQLQ